MQKREFDRLEAILEKLEILQTRFDMFENRIRKIEESCGNMDEHISFIEKVYEKLRAPLKWISGKISSSSTSLPTGRQSNLLRNKRTQ